MRPSTSDPAIPSKFGATHPQQSVLREQLNNLVALAARLEADTILLSGDRDAALREIAQLRVLLVRSLPTLGIRAECGDDPAARELSMEIRAALRD
jgi:hypothetical protein